MGLGIFNEYTRSNFMSGSGDSVENLLHSAYEYGFEFIEEIPLLLVCFIMPKEWIERIYLTMG